jgi:hypothetical protein
VGGTVVVDASTAPDEDDVDDEVDDVDDVDDDDDEPLLVLLELGLLPGVVVFVLVQSCCGSFGQGTTPGLSIPCPDAPLHAMTLTRDVEERRKMKDAKGKVERIP